MALKIDQDAILELLAKYKDNLFLSILVIVTLYGGWSLYDASSRTVDDFMRDYLETGNSRTTGKENTALASDEITTKLVTKQERSLYNFNNPPFGSPENQLRLRQEVQTAYERGVELFQAGQFHDAIQQFDRVITLDVTETRIKYPTLPSEFKRRAQREDARQNFDRILQSSQTDVGEGDRLLADNKSREALTVYERASQTVTEIIDSDPEGKAIGQENLDRLLQLQQTIGQKVRDIQRTTLEQDLNLAVSEAQTALGGNDMLANLQVRVKLVQIQSQITSIDPNGQLISQTDRTRINSLLEQVQKKLGGNFPMMIAQADAAFEKAMTDKNSQMAQQAIWELRQALVFMQAEQNTDGRQELVKKINDYVVRRAQVVIQEAKDFYTAQKQALDQGNYGQFDTQGKARYLTELGQLIDVGGANLAATMKDDINNLRKQIVSLRLPPPVTDDYQIIKVISVSGGFYEIEFMDNTRRTTTTQRSQKIRLREGMEDRRTKITLKQVDTSNGFVILSKLGYLDAKVPLSSSN